MKKNLNAATRRDEKIKNKHDKQARIMTVICIVVAVLVAALAVWWLVSGIRGSIKDELPQSEMQELFESNENIPPENDPIIGSWYFYYDDTIVGKYQFNPDGKLLVFDWSEQGYNIKSLTDYRVRKDAKKLYVKPDGSGLIVEYDYTLELVEEKDNVYMMSWTYDNQTWRLVKIVEQ